MKQIILAITSIMTIALSTEVNAQNRWSLQVSNGISLATKDLGDADLGLGIGFDGLVAYRFMPHLAAYAGWGWNNFSSDNSFLGKDIDFEETGYKFGLQFIHPLGGSRLNYLVQAGVILDHIEAENDEGDIIADSDHGFGWQVSAGLAIPMGDRLRLLPNVKYSSLTREIKFNPVNKTVDLNYFSTGVSLSWAF